MPFWTKRIDVTPGMRRWGVVLVEYAMMLSASAAIVAVAMLMLPVGRGTEEGLHFFTGVVFLSGVILLPSSLYTLTHGSRGIARIVAIASLGAMGLVALAVGGAFAWWILLELVKSV
jgi:hypothetical protein